MASHGRRKSRGSMSMFSVDTVRSFSRTGSHQVTSPAPLDFCRSPSSLSYCDPNNQPPATAAHQAPSISTAASPHNSTDALTNARPENRENEPAIKRFARPISWFPFGKARGSPQPPYPRSFSERFRLPRGQSSTSVAKSTISAPVLTSTTNTKVAKSEGVHCGELTQETFDKSTWNGKLGWVANDNEHRIAAVQARCVAERIEAEDKFRLKPAARLQKMGEAVRDKFRKNKSSDQLRFRAIAYSGVDELGESSKQRTTRRKAETVNLCKDKIRALTGNADSHARSYSTAFLGTTPKPDAERKGSPPISQGDNKSTISSAAFSDHSARSTEASTPKPPTWTSSGSKLSSWASAAGAKERGRDRDRLKSSISDPLPIESKLTNDHIDEANPVVPKWQAIPAPAETADTDKMLAAMPEVVNPTSANKQDAPEWARAPVPEGYISSPNSPTKDKVAAPDVRRARLEQQDPLATHADVEAVAKAPAGKRESMLDMMQFLKESEEEVVGPAKAAKEEKKGKKK